MTVMLKLTTIALSLYSPGILCKRIANPFIVLAYGDNSNAHSILLKSRISPQGAPHARNNGRMGSEGGNIGRRAGRRLRLKKPTQRHRLSRESSADALITLLAF